MIKDKHEINISDIPSEECVILFLRKQRKIGLIAAFIGLLFFVLGFSILVFLPNYFYLGIVFFAIGLIKSIVYFSNYFVMKTKLSINSDLFILDKNSYLIEQEINSKRAYNVYQKLLLASGFIILLSTYFLTFFSFSNNIKSTLLAILIHSIIIFVIFYCEFSNAKSVYSPADEE